MTKLGKGLGLPYGTAPSASGPPPTYFLLLAGTTDKLLKAGTTDKLIKAGH